MLTLQFILYCEARVIFKKRCIILHLCSKLSKASLFDLEKSPVASEFLPYALPSLSFCGLISNVLSFHHSTLAMLLAILLFLYQAFAYLRAFATISVSGWNPLCSDIYLA